MRCRLTTSCWEQDAAVFFFCPRKPQMTRDSIVQMTLRHPPPSFLSIILAPMNEQFSFYWVPCEENIIVIAMPIFTENSGYLPLENSYNSFSKITYSGLRMMSDQVCDGGCRDCGVETGAGQICNAYNHRLGGD